MTAKRPAKRRTANKTATGTKTRATARSKAPSKTTARPKSAARTAATPKAKSNAKAKAKASSAPRKAAAPKPASRLRDVVLNALAELKAVDVKALDVRGLTDITDTMVVASGTSDRHVKSLAERVTQRCKEAGFRPYGMEGERDGEWVLLDLQDVVLHVMLPRVREFYALEKLWAGEAAA
jgi:ribosome silencing factor RsfS/YbeB/iojap